MIDGWGGGSASIVGRGKQGVRHHGQGGEVAAKVCPSLPGKSEDGKENGTDARRGGGLREVEEDRRRRNWATKEKTNGWLGRTTKQNSEKMPLDIVFGLCFLFNDEYL